VLDEGSVRPLPNYFGNLFLLLAVCFQIIFVFVFLSAAVSLVVRLISEIKRYVPSGTSNDIRLYLFSSLKHCQL